jgi:hypothetical protein
MPPQINYFFPVFFNFFQFTFCRVLLFAECFADKFFAEHSLPSATLGKAFAECKNVFAECFLSQ